MSRRNNFETAILKQIADHYLNSGDFNGISLKTILKDRSPATIEIVKALVQKQVIEIVWGQWDFPHIKRLPIAGPPKQLEAIEKGSAAEICVYPTNKHMRHALAQKHYRNRPFTRLLALGHPQLEPRFFELGVLERYQSDPRYLFEFDGLAGKLSVTNKHYRARSMAGSDKVYLQSFGLGFDVHRRRVAVAFLRYLSNLTPRHQQHWHSHRLTGKCKVESNYFRRSVFGEWTQGVSVYQAVLEEICQINKLCQLIGVPHLFKEDFGNEKPKGFGLLIKLTYDSYLEFAHTLDKIVSENLNLDFFKSQGLTMNHEQSRDDGRIQTVSKRTIRLLEEWLALRIRFEYLGAEKQIVAPFKTVNKLRQPRAHTIIKDEYSADYQHKTEALVSEVYTSLSNIRMLFQTHPNAKTYEFPERLNPKNVLAY